jgi:UDP-N-acetylmuramate dehydrogenase
MDMDMQTNVSLKDFSTMRLGGVANSMCNVRSAIELEEAVQWAANQNLPVIVIGEGSNIFWGDNGYPGLVIINKIMGINKTHEDDKTVTYKIGAGEDWDSVVSMLSGLNLSGIECLSLIPGKAGATPVQNVGAYGQEIADTLVSVDAFDSSIKQHVKISNSECNFGYRSSRFKTTDKGRFFITSINFKLKKSLPLPPFYASLQAYLDLNKITAYTPKIIREAVVAIRSDKMPDWHKIANNGSFFANPIVTKKEYETILAKYPEIAVWEYKDGYKLSAGWLLEKAGFKGYHDAETGMATSDKTALVLINENAKSTTDLLKFKQKIVKKVQEMFGLVLEQEPELIS